MSAISLGEEPYIAYRTATLSFLSMCRSLELLVEARVSDPVVIRGLSGIVTGA
jgi:hypothetical protein